MLPMSFCKKALSIIWFVGFLLPFSLLVIRTVLGSYYAGKEDEAWAWFLPTLLPSLSLVLGVFAHEATHPKLQDGQVNKFMFWMTAGLSLFYLLSVSLVFFVGPYSELTPSELMKKSNLFLGPLQGLVSAAMGVFFITSKPAPEVENATSIKVASQQEVPASSQLGTN